MMRSGPLKLMLVGLLGAAFFWLTDPRLGVGSAVDGHASTNAIDAMHAAWPGTLVGLAGSGSVAAIGLALLARRST